MIQYVSVAIFNTKTLVLGSGEHFIHLRKLVDCDMWHKRVLLPYYYSGYLKAVSFDGGLGQKFLTLFVPWSL